MRLCFPIAKKHVEMLLFVRMSWSKSNHSKTSLQMYYSTWFVSSRSTPWFYHHHVYLLLEKTQVNKIKYTYPWSQSTSSKMMVCISFFHPSDCHNQCMHQVLLRSQHVLLHSTHTGGAESQIQLIKILSLQTMFWLSWFLIGQVAVLENVIGSNINRRGLTEYRKYGLVSWDHVQMGTWWLNPQNLLGFVYGTMG